jgi:hypothetical protein
MDTTVPRRLYRLIDSCAAIPVLQIRPFGGKVRVSWPGWATIWSLESTANPALRNGWSLDPTPPVAANGEMSVTIASTNSSRFYRLVLTGGN